MNNLVMFENRQVEVFELDGKILFNPRHIGECLDISESQVREHLSKMNDKQKVKLTNSNVCLIDFRKLHNTGENFITESGVYKLIFKSRKPEAEKFQDWVTDDVLPELRKSGTVTLSRKDQLVLRVMSGTASSEEMQEYNSIIEGEGIEKGKAEAINKRDADKKFHHTGDFLKILNDKIVESGSPKIKYLNSTSFHIFLKERKYGIFVERYFMPNRSFVGKMNQNGWGCIVPYGDGKIRITYDSSFADMIVSYPKLIENLRRICLENN